jgi:pimeloyl-ACP methyl ester carboxylesterase
MKPSVVALPGGVNPAGLRYAPVLSALGGEVDLHLKDLEVYAGEEPPADYSIEGEVEAVSRFADSLGVERFHLLGYSGGGFVSLAFAGTYPERLLSLALFEPASVPGRLSPEEADLRHRLGRELAGLSGLDFMRAFMRLQLRPGVGLAAMMAAFGRHPFDREQLRRCDFPVFLAYGDLTGESQAEP